MIVPIITGNVYNLKYLRSMKNKELHTASKKFRKYIIKINANNKDFYGLWGTDMTDREEDKLLLNRDNKLLLFNSIESIAIFILDNEGLLFDKDNTLGWAKDNGIKEYYTEYNIDSLKLNLGGFKGRVLGYLERDLGMHLIGLINLIGDYAHQTNCIELLNILKGPEVSIFFDYIYDNYFWKKRKGTDERLDKMLKEFDDDKFFSSLEDLHKFFCSKLTYYEPNYNVLIQKSALN